MESEIRAGTEAEECDVTPLFEYNIQREDESLNTQTACTHPGVRHFELPQDVLRHVVLSHGVHHEVLVPGRALGGPVLVTLLLIEQRRRKKGVDDIENEVEM